MQPAALPRSLNLYAATDWQRRAGAIPASHRHLINLACRLTYRRSTPAMVTAQSVKERWPYGVSISACSSNSTQGF